MSWLHLSPEATTSGRLARDLDLVDGTSPLSERWRRALDLGARPEGPESEPIVAESQLAWHRERCAAVVRVLAEALTPTIAGFAARDYTLLFADPAGVVVHQTAGGQFTEVAERVRLQVGSRWDEPTRGTNAIGTALVEDCPVVVHGAAHFARPNRQLVCYAAPVRDPWGETVGVLDATSHVDGSSPLVGAAIFAAARAIEEALYVNGLGGAGRGLAERLLARLVEPAMLVCPRGRITHANRPAVRELGARVARGGSEPVVRLQLPLRRAMALDVADLQAAVRGQWSMPGLEVEPVQTADGRITAYLVVRVPRPAAVAPPSLDLAAFAGVVGHDPAVVAVRHHAARVADSTLPVLIQGETGTGKDGLARGLHTASDRRDGPFVPVNCGAISPSLLHSELFGYVGGAFTGAATEGREGLLARADGGTLFLDEVAELPLDLQAVLLRFLEDGRYHRVGEAVPTTSDVRLVAATCRDLAARVESGTFRADLYYRIRGAVLVLPPVRERQDRDELYRVFLAKVAASSGVPVPPLSPAAVRQLDAHAWPGNLRELKMALHHAVVVGRGHDRIEPWHLPGPAPEARTALAPPAEVVEDLAATEATSLRRALAATRGNVAAAARRLGVARSTVYRMMRRHDLQPDSELR